MLTTADRKVLERLVGSRTFVLGTAYADSGAVRKRVDSGDGSRLVGAVKGREKQPYVVTVLLTRSGSGELLAFRGTCSCPVGENCKHTVALVLAEATPTIASKGPSLTLVQGGRSIPPAWERSLRTFVDSDADETDETDETDVGLQFELVVGTADAGIRLRPVVPGQKGNWVRSGVSWGNLDYYWYGRQRNTPRTARIQLLKEILALSRLANARYTYSYAAEVVRLEAINSRRLWDLLAEARAMGIPLLQSARHVQPVTLLPTPADVTIDLVQSAEGLVVAPRIATSDQTLPLERSLLIGRPAHGVAWWETPAGSPGATPSLGLAPLATVVDEELRALLEMDAIVVPRDDERRFLDGFVPKLRRKMALASSDGSVELPEVRPSTLVLTVHPGVRHRVGLTWERDVEGSGVREALWASSTRARDRAAEDAVVDAVTAIVDSVPQLFETGPFGRRLAPEARLEEMAAVRFLADLLPVLEATDGVVVERIGSVLDYREAAAAPVVSLGGSGSADNDWFDLTVTVTVADEEVPFADLFVALAEEQSHLILPSGTFFSLERDELRELAQLIAEARGLHDSRGDGIRLSRFQASLWEDLQRLGVVTAQASEWEESVRALAGATDRTEHPAPSGLHATLRPYQHAGFNWLAFLYEHRLGGILADDMGLGKTLQALALICHTKEQGLTDAPYLVVAPTSVVGNWVAECRRFAPDLGVVAVTETERRRGTTLRNVAAGLDVVVTSYSLFRIEYDDYAGVEWAGLFLDEAQFAKNRQSQTYQRAKMLPVSFKVAMSGTPIENNLMELWSLLSIAAPGLFANPERFGEYYRVPIEKGSDGDRLAQLRRRVRPLLLRRTKEQVASDLPDKQEQVLELDLNPKHHRIYQTYLQRERQKVLGLLDDMTKNRFEIFRSLTLLRQASLDVSLVDAKHKGVPSTKLDALMEMLEDIVADEHRVLVFSQFTRFLTLARTRIRKAGIEHCYLDGRTRNRPAVIDEFRQGDAPVFLISLKAGGFGLNLTEADYCILLDPWWNPATEAQAVDRVHRIGQTRKVMVYRLVAKDTLEEKVMALKAQKAALFANVMDGGGFESGAMTAADIRDLLD